MVSNTKMVMPRMKGPRGSEESCNLISSSLRIVVVRGEIVMLYSV
jgi:hypothetical protein